MGVGMREKKGEVLPSVGRNHYHVSLSETAAKEVEGKKTGARLRGGQPALDHARHHRQSQRDRCRDVLIGTAQWAGPIQQGGAN